MRVTLPTPAAALGFVARNWLPLILIALLVVQTVRIEGLGIWPIKIVGLQDKYDAAITKLNEARRELAAISTRKNEQAETTRGNIGKAETIRDEAERVAREIEAAPVSGDCRTPDFILNSDL